MRASGLLVAVVCGLILNAGGLKAADKAGAISQGTLAQLGLSGMQPVSDEEGMHIRGKGWVVNVTNINNVTVNTNTNITVANFGGRLRIEVKVNPDIRVGPIHVGIAGPRRHH